MRVAGVTDRDPNTTCNAHHSHDSGGHLYSGAAGSKVDRQLQSLLFALKSRTQDEEQLSQSTAAHLDQKIDVHGTLCWNHVGTLLQRASGEVRSITMTVRRTTICSVLRRSDRLSREAVGRSLTFPATTMCCLHLSRATCCWPYHMRHSNKTAVLSFLACYSLRALVYRQVWPASAQVCPPNVLERL